MERDGFIKTVQLLLLVMGLVLSAEFYLRTAAVAESQTIAPQTATAPSVSDSRLRQDLDQALKILTTCFGEPVELDRVRSEPITMTAYSSTVSQCDDTPHITASMQPVRPGIIAVSDDLVKELGLQFGQRVLIPGLGIYEVQDRMHPRWRRTVDIWVADRKAALLFGRQKGTLFWVVPREKNGDGSLAQISAEGAEGGIQRKLPET